ncbi:MAG: alpha/beta hydrolase [Dermatophilaceae bacterium]
MARRRTIGTALAVACMVAIPIGSTAAAARPGGASSTDQVITARAADRTTSAERARVDRVPTPRPDWFSCDPFATGAECATVPLPLDYDRPDGPTIDIAMLRLTARQPARKIGTLFLNPGGPGGSGVAIAAAATQFLGNDILDRFDIIGFDPRGTNFSDPVQCWGDLGAQFDALEGIVAVPFPFTRSETRAYVRSSVNFGEACSSTGRPLAGSMSTATVARDMDVLRRMVGDRQLTYLGFSYGSYLGTVYANLFPDRVRAVAIDGVVDPVAWAGTAATADVPQTQRIGSGEGAARVLAEILDRCAQAGPRFCRLARRGDPEQLYTTIRTRLQAEPLIISDPSTGEPLELGDNLLTAVLLSDMYTPFAGEVVVEDLTSVLDLLEKEAPTGSAAASRQDEARTQLRDKATAVRSAGREDRAALARTADAVGWGFPYDNSPEAFQSVLCTDGRNPARAADWPGFVAAGESSAPDFGALWTWASSPCARSTWTVQDEDSYRGPFTRTTTSPVLVVGNLWDPATAYSGAVRASQLLPNSRLLTSDSWGHTAYGTSDCATVAIERYLLARSLPAAGTQCVGDEQPFATPITDPTGGGLGQGRPTDNLRLPPVVPPFPGAAPRR